MTTFLFNEIIFGPVSSRRLGVSLGINLLPIDKKYCNFDCLYCECGWTCNDNVSPNDLPSREIVKNQLIRKIGEMKIPPDVLTFAGNGEPTMHPDFKGIIEDTVALRNELCSNARIAVLSNSTTLHKKSIVKALKLVDQPILKLDTALEQSYKLINRPIGNRTINEIIKDLHSFGEGLILQTLFFKGNYKNTIIDNTSENELTALFKAYLAISPSSIMVYTFERDTPTASLSKISSEKLEEIGKRIRNLGFQVSVSA